MRNTFHTALAYGTLFVDAYLALVSVATRMMKGPFASSLLPVDSGDISERTRFFILLVATWTAALAIGSLRSNRDQAESPHAPGTLWFILVLATVWIVYLTPPLIEVLRNLFVRGL